VSVTRAASAAAGRQLALFLVAVQFLTRLPVPALAGFRAEWLARSARYFPLVGALAGALGVCVWWLASLLLPPAVAAGLMMAAGLLLTGAFHEDGLADACDGFGGGTSRESVLAIMKDSRIGSYGAIGIGMVLGLKWLTLVSLPAAAFPGIVVASQAISRWCATALIWRLPYARPDGAGKSVPFAAGLGGADWLLSGGLGVLAILIVLPLSAAAAAVPWAAVLLCGLAAAAATALAAGLYFRARIGGYTGDCLGATQQLTELVFLVASLAALRGVQPP
jgi:adenosylcobinamide-GDP ribazoletransferase